MDGQEHEKRIWGVGEKQQQPTKKHKENTANGN